MHELGVVFHIVDQLTQVAEENRVEKISAVTLQLGEVSTVIPDYLLDCWRWAADKRDLLRGARMNIETIPAVSHCDGCGQDYGTVEHGKICPSCGSDQTWLVQGNEFIIKEIEAE